MLWIGVEARHTPLGSGVASVRRCVCTFPALRQTKSLVDWLPDEGGPTVSQLSDQRGRVIFPAQRAEVVGVATGAGAAVVARVAVLAGVLGWLR